MHDDRAVAEKRIDRVLRERLFPAVYTRRTPCEIAVWHVPGEPVPAEEALRASYAPALPGLRWGPPWGTSWFRVDAAVPPAWASETVEAVVDLGFEADRPGFQCEGLVYLPDGTPVKGLHPRSNHIPVPAGGQHRWFIEAAANPLILGPRGFQPTTLGDPATAGSEPLYVLRRAELAVLNTDVWHLLHDTEVLTQLMRELGEDTPRRHEILRALQRMIDRLDLGDVPASAAGARAELAEVLSRPAHASAHRLSAVGHAHIDSAWLWPLRETIRKVARTTASVTELMAGHPQLRFAMSQAQQLAWIKQHYPVLYQRIQHFVHTGQFVPAGGMWVEADTNMPGGEAMARQFAAGKRFFLDEFGIDTQEVWLPDSFGYSAALPQLVALSGSRWFLTQKLSWNQTNRFPHHTFWWQGIDGTRVFTHFPPADTYNAELTGGELARASRQFAEHGWATRSLVPFGHGDGGGGPTRDMLARAGRTADLEGSPRVALETPAEFFRAAEADHDGPAVWSGELYLELHRGTYTSQAKTKQGNRRCEHLLREAELWCATAATAGLAEYPYDELDRLWKTVLLHQFHDILPGSSIAWVHREAQTAYEETSAELDVIISRAQRALAGPPGEQVLTFNATPHPHDQVPPMGAAAARPAPPPSATQDGEMLVLANDSIQATVDTRGLLISVIDLRAGRELIAPGTAGNLLQLHPDHPNDWDAWDLDAHYRNTCRDLTSTTSVGLEEHHGAPAVRVQREFGNSAVTQWIQVPAGAARVDIGTSIDWHETEKILKAAFPLDIHAGHSASETQFGHVFRPVHTNTSWDAAKFEICAHRWIHLAEAGYGIALANDSTYGHDVTSDTRSHGGGCTTTVRLSLLRAPRFPDPHTDQGPHHLRYALVAAPSIGDAVREGYRINLPARTVAGSGPVPPLMTVRGEGVIAETVKLAEDRSGDVVIRLYESRGGRAEAVLTPGFAADTAWRTDLLERPLTTPEPVSSGVRLRLRPFEIVTLRLARSR